MQLERPIIFFDLETTGVDTENDRIVQIGAIKRFPDGQTEEKNILVNPQRPIPKPASEVHGITDDRVRDKPIFQQYAKSMHQWFSGCDLAGYNSNQFDIPMLAAEFRRCGHDFPDADAHFVDMLLIERLVNSHRLEETYKRYTGQALEGAHDAVADIRATIAILDKQLERHPDLPTTPKELDTLTTGEEPRADISGKLRWSEGTLMWNFGKHRGKPVLETLDYAKWFLRADFPPDAKALVEEAVK
ncbi:MAG: 3'-5' exonuclease [Caldilineaceae bacterium]|nr:3'-5' exonuclease [Caldilineaceae bacterium]